MKAIPISKWVAAAAILVITALPTFAQVTNLNLGQLAPGESVTITFAVTVNSPLPAGLQGITNQAAVSATGLAPVNSDDPRTGLLHDPTVTLLVQPPGATTLAATGVGHYSATLNGLVNPGGDDAGYYFEFGTNLATTVRTLTNTLSASYTTSAVAIDVVGLQPNTVYQFRALTTNTLGLVPGAYLSFTTTVFSITGQPADNSACLGGTATFAVSVNSSAQAGYQWQRRDSGAAGFNNINGATNSSYTTPPTTAAADGDRYRALVSAPGTNLTSSEALLTVIAITSPAITYDFNGGLPPNTAVYGSAFVSNGVLVLTTNGGGQFGGFLTADLAPGRVVRGITATFNLRIANGSGLPAEGFSFNWATDLPNAPLGEEGGGSGLTVSFDTFDSGLGEAPAIDVKWNSNVVSHVPVPLSFISDFSGNFRVASIRLSSDGILDLVYNCAPVVTRVAIPGYAPQLGARFHLGARTGSEFASHSIDDFALQLDVDQSNNVPRIISITKQPPMNILLFGGGNPGQNVALLATTNLANPFTWLANVTPNSSGVFALLETMAVMPQRFYRLHEAAQFPPGLVTWWRAESNRLDSFGRNHGSSTNLGFASGQRGQAFNFNGTNQNLLIGGEDIPVPWTATFWVRRQDASGASAALLTSPQGALKLEQTATSRQVGFTAFGVADYAFDYSAPLNVWTHLAFVGAPDSTVLFTNGVIAATSTNSISLPLNILGTRQNGADQLRGLVDETTIFNRALSPTEIQQVLNATRGP